MRELKKQIIADIVRLNTPRKYTSNDVIAYHSLGYDIGIVILDIIYDTTDKVKVGFQDSNGISKVRTCELSIGPDMDSVFSYCGNVYGISEFQRVNND